MRKNDGSPNPKTSHSHSRTLVDRRMCDAERNPWLGQFRWAGLCKAVRRLPWHAGAAVADTGGMAWSTDQNGPSVPREGTPTFVRRRTRVHQSLSSALRKAIGLSAAFPHQAPVWSTGGAGAATVPRVYGGKAWRAISWEQLTGQIYLGSEKFVARHQPDV
jgi:hypothetical protein